MYKKTGNCIQRVSFVLLLLLGMAAGQVLAYDFTTSPIHLAVKEGNLEEVKKQLSKGVDIELPVSGVTPLALAAAFRREEIASFLISKGANVNGENFNGGDSPLFEAVLNGSETLVALLLYHGAKVEGLPNEDKFTTLHLVAMNADKNAEEAIRLLLLCGANPEAGDRYGKKPRDWAKGYIIKQVLGKWPDVSREECQKSIELGMAEMRRKASDKIAAEKRLVEQEKQLVEKFNRFRRAAEQGDARAQIELGNMYRKGLGVAKSDAEAVKWYRRAAEQGDARAQIELGNMYRKGLGVAKSDAEAVKWYLKAAEQGNASAQNEMGYIYKNGLGVTNDDVEAVKWYRKAADQGFAMAQNNMGFMYEKGLGVTSNDAKALEWYRKAVDQGNASAQNNLGFMYLDARGVAQNIEEGIKLVHKAAEQGDASAQNNLCSIYTKRSYGSGYQRKKREEWCYEAANKGNTIAQYNLGDYYYSSRSYDKAYKWFLTAAEKGNVDAITDVGYMYYHGKGVHKNHAKAKEWWSKAIKKGDERAESYLEQVVHKEEVRQQAQQRSYYDSNAQDRWRERQNQMNAHHDRALGHAYFGTP